MQDIMLSYLPKVKNWNLKFKKCHLQQYSKNEMLRHKYNKTCMGSLIENYETH